MLSLFEPEMTMLEQTELQQYEAVIERGLQTYVDVGNALMAIRDKRLYRQTSHGSYSSFEDYCQERWRMGRDSAARYIQAAKVVQNITSVDHDQQLPASIRQTMPLVTLSPDDQRAAWQEAVENAPENAPGGKITGAYVATVAEKYKQPGPEETRVIDPDTGEIETDEPEPEPITPNRAYKNSSESNEWYTPAPYVERARLVMGGIDLDPASSAIANETVKAETYYTIEDDGLLQDWLGRVFLNPPYGNEVEAFVGKLVGDYKAGDVKEAVLLVAARTDTAWFRKLRDFPRCFLWGRVKFINGETGEPGDPAGFPSMIVYLGNNASMFIAAFSDIGDIYEWRKQ